MYAFHIRLIRNIVRDFLFVIIELFSLDAFVLSQSTRLTERRTDGQNPTSACSNGDRFMLKMLNGQRICESVW